MRSIVCLLALGCGLHAAVAEASDDGAPNGNETSAAERSADDLVGWGESDTAEEVAADPPGTPDQPSPLTAGGRYRLRGALWMERLRGDPLAQARNFLGLWLRYGADFELLGQRAAVRLTASGRGEYDAAYLIDRGAHDAPTLEAYEWLLLRDETYASLTVGGAELRVGWQHMPLGQGEALGLLNQLNPRDLRDPGLTAPEDLSIAVLASRLSITAGDHRFDAFVVHEASFDLRAPPLGRLSPLRRLLLRDPLAGPALARRTLRDADVPSGFGIASWQALGRYAYTRGGVDLQWYAGSVLDKLGVVQLPSPAELLSTELTLRYFHPRYTLLGTAGAWAVGEVLVRWELVAELDRPLAVRAADTVFLQIGMERHTQLSLLVGLTYFGLADTNLGLELTQSYVHGAPERQANGGREFLLPVERTDAALRVQRTFLRERLLLQLVGVMFGIADWNAALVRGEIGYVLADGLVLAVGYVAYLPSDQFGPLYGFDRNDRSYVDLRWDFTLP